MEPDFDEGPAPCAEVLELHAELADADGALVPGDYLMVQAALEWLTVPRRCVVALACCEAGEGCRSDQR